MTPSARAGLLPEGSFSSKASGTTSAGFLNAPIGARAAAMGGAQAASAQGSEALFQNPAALGRFQPESPSEISLGYAALLETSYQGFSAYARPLGRNGTMGAGFLHVSQAAQIGYDAGGDESGRFTPLDLAAGAVYAHRLGGVMLGAGLKLIRSSLAERSGMTAAADFGLLALHAADMGEGPLDVGVSVSNIGPPLKLGGASDPLPLRSRAGGLWHVTPVFDAAVDMVFAVDQDPYAQVGLEARLPAAALGSAKPWSTALRAGYDQNRARGLDVLAGISAGLGFDFSALRADYAWLPMGDLGSTNRITLAFRF